MKLIENGPMVTLEMTRGDWQNLLAAVGIAAGVAAQDTDKEMFRHWIDFASRLNATVRAV
jgi:hypothetical protein